MSDSIMQFDSENADLRILGRRYVTVDLTELCEHMDSLVGLKVAGAIMGSHGRSSGKEDVEKIRSTNPKASNDEITRHLIESDRIGGIGVTKVTFTGNESSPAKLEMRNPVAKASEGTAVSYILSCWAGALSAMFGRTLKPTSIFYNQQADTLHCEFTKE